MGQTLTGASGGPEPRPMLVYDGGIGELYGIFLVNLLLTIITLGIYRFWAITRIRRYLWSHMRFEGTRFSYTGKGSELFLGFVLAMLILGLIFAGVGLVSAALARHHPGLAAIPIAIAYAGVFALWGAAHFSAQRYRLSRTEWRGIRGGMQGSAPRYGLSWLLYLLLSIVTLYQAIPWMQVGLARRRIDASRFGSAVFRCDARAGHLYLTWLGAWFGCLAFAGIIAGVVLGLEWPWLKTLFSGGIKLSDPALGPFIVRAIAVVVIGILAWLVACGLLATWYYASLLRLILGHTSAVVPSPRGDETLSFGSTVTAGGLLWLVASNLLLIIVTLGLGLPIVLHRYAHYIARTTMLRGTFDADALAQTTLARPAVGEGFLQALDPGIV